MRLTASPIRRERPLIRKRGWGITERDRWTEIDRGRGEAVLHEKGGTPIDDVENVETMLSSSHWPPFCYSFVSSISVCFSRICAVAV